MHIFTVPFSPSEHPDHKEREALSYSFCHFIDSGVEGEMPPVDLSAVDIYNGKEMDKGGGTTDIGQVPAPDFV